MIHAILLAAYLRLIMGEGQRMGRSIDFRDNLDELRSGLLLEINELALGVIAVASSEAGIGVALQAEGSVGTAPVVTIELLETIVVEMHLQGIHLIIGHHFHQVTQIGHGDELAPAVHHETAQGVVGPVAQLAFRQLVVFTLLADLEQGARSPVGTDHLGSRDSDVAVHPNGIALTSQLLVFLQRQIDVTLGRLALNNSRSSIEHPAVVGGKGIGHGAQSILRINDTHPCLGHKHSFLPLPFFQLRDDKGFLILGI